MAQGDDGDAVGALVKAIKARGLQNARIGVLSAAFSHKTYPRWSSAYQKALDFRTAYTTFVVYSESTYVV